MVHLQIMNNMIPENYPKILKFIIKKELFFKDIQGARISSMKLFTHSNFMLHPS